jgi:hypothetical protein
MTFYHNLKGKFSSVRLNSQQIQMVRAEWCFRDCSIGLQES